MNKTKIAQKQSLNLYSKRHEFIIECKIKNN